jgi:hypothetical protein
MKSYRKAIEVNVPARMAFLDSTGQAQEALNTGGIKEGLAIIKAIPGNPSIHSV